MLPPVVAELLRACMRATEIRIVFSGPTGSGKSTLVRACLGELPALARVVIVEDTAELDLFDPVSRPNVESWEERLANNEGEGAITQGQQVKHALRYRPDWLVCGEVRDSDAAVPMLKAMTHGQAALTTVHAGSAEGALDKLALYLATGEDRLAGEVAHNQLRLALDFVVHVDRGPDGRRGDRMRRRAQRAAQRAGVCCLPPYADLGRMGQAGHVRQARRHQRAGLPHRRHRVR